MSSPTIPLRRRRVPIDFESDSDDEHVQTLSKQRAVPSSRARTTATLEDGYSETDDDSGTVLPDNYRSSQPAADLNGAADHGFQPGAIVRVKMTNFVTYDNVEYHPGPNLNMVIGPNGTGKSSLVCAICLGLGYSPKNLGRADNVGDFVKHGHDEAIIETELSRAPDQSENPVVQLRITRDGDKRRWRLDGRETSLKAIQQLTRKFGIQIDNLCQFLPQDRVAEFAGLSPVELLHETQRAAAAEEMLEWHAELKRLSKEQNSLQLEVADGQERLGNLRSRQQNVRLEVERIREREEIQSKLDLMEKATHFIKYKAARLEWQEAKQLAKDAGRALKDLEQQVEPTMQAVNAKQHYESQVEVVARERLAILKDATARADALATAIDGIDQEIKDKDELKKAEHQGDAKRKQAHQTIAAKIRDLEIRAQDTPPEFDSAEWNARIRQKEHTIRDLDRETRDLREQDQELRKRAGELRQDATKFQNDRAALESHVGKQIGKLRKISSDTATAWEWIKANQHKFEMPVFGPPMVECTVKDPRYVNELESLFQLNDFVTITTQTKADFRKLSNILYKDMRLADITLKTSTGTLAEQRPPMSREQLQTLGFERWALDLIDGPEPVLAILCVTLRLNATAIALGDISNEQYSQVVDIDSPIQSFVAGKQNFRVTRRREYGASSTQTKPVLNARVWTDDAVDFSARDELTANITRLESERRDLGEKSQALMARLKEIASQRESLSKELDDVKEQKNRQQTAAGIFAALPDKIRREKESLQLNATQGEEVRQRIRDIDYQIDDLIVEKGAAVFQHQEQVAVLRTCHHELEEAQIRQLEAKCDIAALKERNVDIERQLHDEQQNFQNATADAREKKAEAEASRAECQKVLADAGDERDYFEAVSEQDVTVAEWQTQIEAETAKLEIMAPGDPHALTEYERREGEMKKLDRLVLDKGQQLEAVQQEIQIIRSRWEPELDRLVGEISDAFSHNFAQIRCTGEVSLAKPDDYDQWAIQIRVKFRQNEELQLLDQHRQSGGERSVSTIFYLMSLQSLARAPFRVVDEINQGMDPRNERMVHERMVEIACKEHTSQYFLITPKLLTGLRYDRGMKVLCIASGEYMPVDYRQLDVREVIRMKRALAAAS